MENTKEQRWIYLDACRILSILFIVVMNVASGQWGYTTPGSYDWNVLNVFNGLSRFAYPLFVMVTGALVLNEKKELSIKEVYKDYVLRLVVIFFIWSIMSRIMYYFQDAPNGFADFSFPMFLLEVIKGDPYKHWFIFVILGLYFCIPIMRVIGTNMRISKYFLIMWALSVMIVTFIHQLPAIITNYPENVGNIMNQVAGVIYQVRPTVVLEYAGYFLLGHYIHVKVFTKKETAVVIGLGVLAFLFTIGITMALSIRDNHPNEAFFQIMSLNICLMASAVMVAVKAGLADKWFSNHMYRALLFFSDTAFGIFLIHDFIRLFVVKTLGIDVLIFNPLLSVPVFSIVIFCVSGLVTYFIMKIPKAGKYIV